MRRTLLWVVFTMSLVLLWDAWNKHTGAAVAVRRRHPRPRPRPRRRRAAAQRPAPARRPCRGHAAPPAATGARHRRGAGHGAAARRRADHADHRRRQGDASTAAAASWCAWNCCSYIDQLDRKTQRRAVRPQPRARCTWRADRPGHGRRRGATRTTRRAMSAAPGPRDAAGRRRHAGAAASNRRAVNGVQAAQDLHASSAATTASA